MPPADYSPTLRHRRLTALFRQLRVAAELSREQAASHLDMSTSKITRLETGRWQRLYPREVRALLDVYGVTDEEEREGYVRLAREARQRGWWTEYPDVAGQFVAFESEASGIQTFEPQYVPGLLQTEAYARATITANPAIGEKEMQRRIEVRMERQRLLAKETAPSAWAVVDEAALRRPVGGGEVMAEQLRYLAAVSDRYITVQVLPIAVGAHPGMDGSFTLLTFPHPLDRPVIFLESATEGVYLEDPDRIQRYTLMFNHLMAASLSRDESQRLMRSLADAL